MSNSRAKLDSSQKHLLRLVAEGTELDGWAPVSAVVYPLLDQRMPRELIELEALETGEGRVRLTDQGRALIAAMEWI